jgi:hypothetical protein
VKELLHAVGPKIGLGKWFGDTAAGHGVAATVDAVEKTGAIA